jgi:ABC-type sugar transport system ATPase subunit
MDEPTTNATDTMRDRIFSAARDSEANEVTIVAVTGELFRIFS